MSPAKRKGLWQVDRYQPPSTEVPQYASTYVNSDTGPESRGSTIALCVAVVGIILLVGGIALCFILGTGYSHYDDQKGIWTIEITSPYRDIGFVMVAIGAIVGIVGFNWFILSKPWYGEGKGKVFEPRL